jgi:hypothetical protein
MRISEWSASSSIKVDREAGIIRGVKIIGNTSRNGRFYPPEVLRAAIGLYEGVNVNYNHARDGGTVRSVEDRAGWLRNVSEDQAGGLSGDFHVLKSDPRADKLFEAAERRPETFGLSHTIDGKTSRKSGRDVVESIVKVWSVDIVSDPATTRSLFESQGGGSRRVAEMSLTEFVEMLTENGNDSADFVGVSAGGNDGNETKADDAAKAALADDLRSLLQTVSAKQYAAWLKGEPCPVLDGLSKILDKPGAPSLSSLMQSVDLSSSAAATESIRRRFRAVPTDPAAFAKLLCEGSRFVSV